MTEQQFTVLADLLGLSAPDREAAHKIIFDGKRGSVVARVIVDKLRQADTAIRTVYVIHGPMEFRIIVSHRDSHRFPGALKMKVGDVVKLIAHSTELWIPVQVTTLPVTAADYYTGVITEQPVKASRYQVGNGVRFSEDQVII